MGCHVGQDPTRVLLSLCVGVEQAVLLEAQAMTEGAAIPNIEDRMNVPVLGSTLLPLARLSSLEEPRTPW